MPAKKYYLIGENSVVYDSAKIINGLKDNSKIVLGSSCHIKGELLLFGHGGHIEMGDFSYLGPNSYVWSAKKITIGNRVLISHNCNILDNDTHPLDPVERHKQFREIITCGQPKQIDLNEEEIIIEDDVLIAANSIILKGVRIGKAAIVGAGSVVTRDVPPYTVVAGNPARIVRQLRKENLIG
ncbi:MAG: acyltransferase [Desulfuromonadaceae bacterium]